MRLTARGMLRIEQHVMLAWEYGASYNYRRNAGLGWDPTFCGLISVPDNSAGNAPTCSSCQAHSPEHCSGGIAPRLLKRRLPATYVDLRYAGLANRSVRTHHCMHQCSDLIMGTLSTAMSHSEKVTRPSSGGCPLQGTVYCCTTVWPGQVQGVV